MTIDKAVEQVKRYDSECAKLNRSIQAARQRYETALFELIQAEREHAAACQRRTAFEGKYQDLLTPAATEVR